MTTTEPDTERLRSLVAELDRMLAGPSQQAAVNPDGTPGHVASGELIESAWGNAVATQFDLNRGFFAVTTGESSIAALPGETTIATYTIAAADAAGLYAISFTGTTWTNQNFQLRIYKDSLRFVDVTCSQNGDYAVIASTGVEVFAPGNVVRVALSTLSVAGGLRAGATTVGKWLT